MKRERLRRVSDKNCLLKKNKVCIVYDDACSAYIVKRRLIWRLPGVLGLGPRRPKPVPMMSLMV
ncbi:hypothetical protein AJ87_00410 [Rhizobium yanglingense]|nr:hypothetical protein AJ87_00410 [Rhizobium yanglingense]